MDQQIWQWTLSKEAIAPCFVSDVLAMRQHANRDADFFWLGHTPCRTVLLVGMVVGIQVYDKRTLYTIDDGTAVIDCVLRHPRPERKPRSPPQQTSGPDANLHSKYPSPKKLRLDKTKLESMEPPPPITDRGYPVRVVGKVVRYYESKQIQADTIDPCPSSLDEIAHLECVIELHKTKYCHAVPFVLPHKPKRTPDVSTRAGTDADASIFSDVSRPDPRTSSYALPPPPMPMQPQSRNRPPPIPTHLHTTYHGNMHVPSSPTASSIASSTPSSPCKPSSPTKAHEVPSKPKLRHPSRLHTRDLTGNTFRLYVKHYMDNAPPPYSVSLFSPSRSMCEELTTPKKHARDEDDESTPRPRPGVRSDRDEKVDESTLGFTLSHLRRVPELALLAARVVRSEARRRDKTHLGRDRGSPRLHMPSSSSASASSKPSERKEGNGTTTDPPRKKIKRLFAWAVVKLYEEGSIVLWDGDVRPLPRPPPPAFEAGENRDENGLRRVHDTQSTFGDLTMSTFSNATVLYASSASASLYSHYHPLRRSTKPHSENRHAQTDAEAGADVVDDDADPGNISEPTVDEEAYVPLTPQLLAGHVREAVVALRRGRGRREGVGRGSAGASIGVHGRGMELTPVDILKYLQRSDGRWARLGEWAVEEALVVLKGD